MKEKQNIVADVSCLVLRLAVVFPWPLPSGFVLSHAIAVKQSPFISSIWFNCRWFQLCRWFFNFFLLIVTAAFYLISAVITRLFIFSVGNFMLLLLWIRGPASFKDVPNVITFYVDRRLTFNVWKVMREELLIGSHA